MAFRDEAGRHFALMIRDGATERTDDGSRFRAVTVEDCGIPIEQAQRFIARVATMQ